MVKFGDCVARALVLCKFVVQKGICSSGLVLTMNVT